MAKQRQVKMQYRQGTLAAMQQLEDRTDEQLRKVLAGSRMTSRIAAKKLVWTLNPTA